jgi:streptomycin 3"-adenylyltransferase
MNLSIDPQVDQLLNEIVTTLKGLLGANLVGVYLHGSLAMGSFNPQTSDVDFLVVTSDKLSPETRRELASALLRLTKHAPAKGMEMSVLTVEALRNFQHPTPYEFHFSNAWLERYKNNDVDFTDEDKVDADLAAHLTITKVRGRALYGEPIDAVFPAIPPQYYRDSIVADAKAILADMRSDPVYNVLNLCRVWAYLQDGKITSKQEGGRWALCRTTPFQTSVVEQALAEYAGDKTAPWEQAALTRFGAEMVEKLRL